MPGQKSPLSLASIGSKTRFRYVPAMNKARPVPRSVRCPAGCVCLPIGWLHCSVMLRSPAGAGGGRSVPLRGLLASHRSPPPLDSRHLVLTAQRLRCQERYPALAGTTLHSHKPGILQWMSGIHIPDESVLFAGLVVSLLNRHPSHQRTCGEVSHCLRSNIASASPETIAGFGSGSIVIPSWDLWVP